MSRVVERRWSSDWPDDSNSTLPTLPVQEPLPLRGSFACTGWGCSTKLGPCLLPLLLLFVHLWKLIAAHEEATHPARGLSLQSPESQLSKAK